MNKTDKILELVKQIAGLLENKNNSSKVEIRTLKQGDIFETDKRKYIVLEQFIGMTEIISLDFVLKDEKFDDTEIDYKKSQLKKKCDTEILKDFEEEFGSNNIIEHSVALTTLDGQKCFGVIRSKVRPLTFDEARKYNEILARYELPDWYWTCTAWSTADRGWSTAIAVVCGFGGIYTRNCDLYYGVRPICFLKNDVLVSKVENN